MSSIIMKICNQMELNLEFLGGPIFLHTTAKHTFGEPLRIPLRERRNRRRCLHDCGRYP